MKALKNLKQKVLRRLSSRGEREHILDAFFIPAYQQHNVARLSHLHSLGLPIDGKRVLEVGAGIGDHSLFYLYRGCSVLPTDGRKELVKFIEARLGIPAKLLDVEKSPEQLQELGSFDILHCYGLLYHLNSPAEFLRQCPKVTRQLFLETCVTFSAASESTVPLTPEDRTSPSQALHGIGCRPTREWIFGELKKLFPHVYIPATQPKHPEFPMLWKSEPAHPGKLTRAVFIASHTPISNSRLLTHLPEAYQAW